MSGACKNTVVFTSKTAGFKKLLASSWNSLLHRSQSPYSYDTGWQDTRRAPYIGMRPSHGAPSFDMLVETDVITGTHGIV